MQSDAQGQICFKSDFYLVDKLKYNAWYQYFDTSNINGVLGLGFNVTGSNSFWANSGIYPRQYSVALTTDFYDWGWIPGAPDLFDEPVSSMYMGQLDPYTYKTESSYVGLLST